MRAGFATLVGLPNAGKSTLLNALVGQKVAIVSPKPQTTRGRILGVVNRPGCQLVLVDTPGLTAAVDALRRVMRRVTFAAASESEVLLLVVEARPTRPRLGPGEEDLLRLLKRSRAPVVVALNKIDRVRPKELLLPWIAHWSEQARVEVVVPISATRGDGLAALAAELERRLPEGPALFPEEVFTDQLERGLCAELVREQVLRQLHQEVPHAVAVVIDEFVDERTEAGGRCSLRGRVIVERKSQRGIVVGKGGQRIKAIGSAARREIEALLGCGVFLGLEVEVDPEWRSRSRSVERLGYGGER